MRAMRGAARLFIVAAVCFAAAAAFAQTPSPPGAPPGELALPPTARPPYPPPRIPPAIPPGRQVPPKPVVEDLGHGRYRIGAITVDKTAQRFAVPGEVLNLGPPDAPLEFLAIAKDGMKAYESAVMVDTDAYSFNVACILIGLDASGATQPQHHFDPQPVNGDPVTVAVSWQAEGRTVTKPASALIRSTGSSAPVTDDWVYTGSYFSPDGRYAAHAVGTLIGFVHDRDSIIQHREGLGLGHYGAVTYGGPEAPPAGTPVTVTVAKKAR